MAAETAPYLPSAGVVLTGHACAPRGRPARSMAVRLGVYRDVPLIDKTLHVFGHHGRPFRKLPLGWQRAALSDDNPAGSTGAPSIVDPAHPGRPAGFGPIPGHWPGEEALARPRRSPARRPRRHRDPRGDRLPLLPRRAARSADGLPPGRRVDRARRHAPRAVSGAHAASWRARGGALVRGKLRERGRSRGRHPGDRRGSPALLGDLARLLRPRSEEDPPLHVEAGLSLPDHPVAWRSTGAETPTTKAPPASLAFDPADDATQAVTLPEAEREALPFAQPAGPQDRRWTTAARARRRACSPSDPRALRRPPRRPPRRRPGASSS